MGVQSKGTAARAPGTWTLDRRRPAGAAALPQDYYAALDDPPPLEWVPAKALQRAVHCQERWLAKYVLWFSSALECRDNLPGEEEEDEGFAPRSHSRAKICQIADQSYSSLALAKLLAAAGEGEAAGRGGVEKPTASLMAAWQTQKEVANSLGAEWLPLVGVLTGAHTAWGAAGFAAAVAADPACDAEDDLLTSLSLSLSRSGFSVGGRLAVAKSDGGAPALIVSILLLPPSPLVPQRGSTLEAGGPARSWLAERPMLSLPSRAPHALTP